MKNIDLSKDQLALLDGVAEIEVMSIDDMFNIAGGYGGGIVCQYGTHLNAYGQTVCN